mgnify:CR=1 FL=1
MKMSDISLRTRCISFSKVIGSKIKETSNLFSSDGRKLYTVRISQVVKPSTQFYSTNPKCLDDFEDSDTFLPDGSVLLVSEPLNDLSDKWTEVPSGSFVTISGGEVDVKKLNV